MEQQRKSLTDLYWRSFFCAFGYGLLALTYGCSLFIPPLREMVHEYETTVTVRSRVIVTLVSVIILTSMLIGVQVYTNTVSVATIISLFFVWLLFVYFILSMYSAYRNEGKGSI